MKRLRLLLGGTLSLIVMGCGSKTTTTAPAPTPGTSQSSTRNYNGTASVGDFLTISIDGGSHMLSYLNHSNGDSGTVSYSIAGDGTYELNDPTGNLLAAYEVPNFVLMIQAAKTGPSHDVKSLITCVKRSPISVAGVANHRYNTMQFRTASGGLEVGSVVIDEAGTANNSSYWPYGAQSGSSPFNAGAVSTSSFTVDSSGTFMRLPGDGGQDDYVFGTPNGVFAVDTQNGAILGLEQTATKNFDAARAGTYNAIFYEKVDARSGINNFEFGTPSLNHGTATVSAAGQVTITDDVTGVLATGTLVAVADTPYLYGTPGLLEDACNGLFTVRISTPSSQQDLFVTFVSGAMLFSSYKTALPMGGGNTYDYFYGVGLR